MKRLLGERFGFTKTGLVPNTPKNISLKITDTLGKEFISSGSFQTDLNGTMKIPTDPFQGLIATASSDRQAAFVLAEYEQYHINVTADDGTIDDDIVIDSGIGSILCKEEWRGDIVGNLFYPSDTSRKNKAIIHINGGVPVLQDGRSIMLAREGYTVLELGYNLPQYGQENMFFRTEPIDISYFEQAARRLLTHHSVYGDKVAVVGQSKGVEFAVAFGCLVPDLVEVTLVNSSYVSNPSFMAITYGDQYFKATDMDFSIYASPEQGWKRERSRREY